MYNDLCKDCENLGRCKHMMNMPMMNMPIMNNMPMCDYLMPEDEDEDEDLKRLYPKIYIRIYPMVKHQCDMMESMHGTMYCPSKEELDHICEQMCDMHEEHHKDDHDDDDDCRDDDMRRRRRRGRRGVINNLIRILLIKELHGRRRRRRPKYGYGY